MRRAFAWYLTGEYSDGALADRLNADGMVLPDGTSVIFRTKGILGRYPPGPFTKDSVREICCSGVSTLP